MKIKLGTSLSFYWKNSLPPEMGDSIEAVQEGGEIIYRFEVVGTGTSDGKADSMSLQCIGIRLMRPPSEQSR